MFTPPLPFSGPCYALQCCLSVCVSFYLSVPHKTLQKLLSLVRNILTFAQCNWHTHFGQNWSKVKVTRGSSKFSNRRYSMLTVGFKSMTAGISKCGYTAKLMFGFSQACVGAWLLLSSGITTRWNTKLKGYRRSAVYRGGHSAADLIMTIIITVIIYYLYHCAGTV